MSTQREIHLDKFKPRDYQLKLCDALENKGFRKLVAIFPRRSGKDVCCWNLMIRQALRKIGVYFYCLPTFSQARKVIWDSITNDGTKFVDFIPKELIRSSNSSELKITLINGSIIQLIGSDSYDRIVGSNPRMIVMSEYALADPRAIQFFRPIIHANGGVICLVSTPRGKNHLWELFNIAKNNPDEWYSELLTLADTKHISWSEIQKEIESGEISDDLAQQEYNCSFDQGIEGAYYAKYVDKMHTNGQIGIVPWEPGFKVETAWDIGVRDSTCIIFFQRVGQIVRVIDCYEKSKEGLEHYVKVIESKPYSYGKHFAPHDIAVREFGSGLSRLEKARELGIKFETRDSGKSSALPNISIEDGIEAVRSSFAKMWIDEKSCKPLIRALENYRQEWDSKRKVYRSKPLHDSNCFVGSTLLLTRNGMRPIMDINIGDEVLTLIGWKKCLQSRMTKKNATIVEVEFQDGTKVRCTPDHLFLTESGWKSAESLKKHTKIQSSLMKLQHILPDLYTEYGLMKSISLEEEQDCTEMFGDMLLERYLKDTTFTTKITIRKIVDCTILNACREKNICLNHALMLKDLQDLLLIKLQSGINQMKEESGIVFKQFDVDHGKIDQGKIEIVPIVQKSFLRWSEEEELIKGSVIPTAKHLIIEKIKHLKETEDVYDIEVVDAHHFSLANGAIVHNSHFSDAFRYLVLSLSRTRDGQSSAQDLDNRYREACGGQDSSMPNFFRDNGSRY